MPKWRNGRRGGLKIRWPLGREGSIPSFGTRIARWFPRTDATDEDRASQTPPRTPRTPAQARGLRRRPAWTLPPSLTLALALALTLPLPPALAATPTHASEFDGPAEPASDAQPALDPLTREERRLHVDADLRIRSALGRGIEASLGGLTGAGKSAAGTSFRFRLGSDFDLEHVGARIELQSSHDFGGSSPADQPPTIGLQQGYLHLTSRPSLGLRLDAGRMRLDYGAGRHIGGYDFHGTGHAYDGARLRWSLHNRLSIDVLGVRLRRDDAQPDRQRSLVGVYATAQPTGSLVGDLYLLVLDDGADAGRLRLQTMGVRLDWRPWGVARLETEFAGQVGSRDGRDPAEQSHLAWMGVLRLGVQLGDAIPVAGGVLAEHWSGDRDPDDGIDSAWRPLYGNLDELTGLLQLFAPTNLQTLGLWTMVGDPKRWSHRLDARLMSRLASPGAASGLVPHGWRAVGGEIDVRSQWALSRALTLGGSGGLFLPAEDAGQAGATQDLAFAVLIELRGRF